MVKFLPIFLAALLFCAPAPHAQEAPSSTRPLMAQAAEDRLVWLNTATGVYHYSGTRWYGKTKQGKLMGEAEARGLRDTDQLGTSSEGYQYEEANSLRLCL